MKDRMHLSLLCSSFLISAGVAFAAPAFAEQPWISVPSTANEKQELVIRGGNLSPGSSVLLRLGIPDGQVANEAVPVDADGRLAVAYTLEVPGRYTVEAYDMAGAFLGGGMLGFIR